MPDPDWARLRAIMYQPTACWLVTENSGDRWLTDQYVMFDVTGMEAFKPCSECRSGRICGECPPGYPDGAYKLTVSEGPKPRKSVPEPDIEGYFRRVAELSEWRLTAPSEWSVAEHPGKAMLWYTSGVPCLLGESTWTAIKRHYPDVRVEYAHGELNIFRFSLASHIDPGDDCAAGECGCPSIPFAYAAGIQIPEGQEDVARAIVQTLDSTGNPA